MTPEDLRAQARNIYDSEIKTLDHRVTDLIFAMVMGQAEAEVKAAGGIRTADSARAMLEAGATRIGTSSGIDIVRGG